MTFNLNKPKVISTLYKLFGVFVWMDQTHTFDFVEHTFLIHAGCHIFHTHTHIQKEEKNQKPRRKTYAALKVNQFMQQYFQCFRLFMFMYRLLRDARVFEHGYIALHVAPNCHVFTCVTRIL